MRGGQRNGAGSRAHAHPHARPRADTHAHHHQLLALAPGASRLKLRIQAKNREFWDIDATPLVGPDGDYCRSIGFTDGRTICAVRPEGDPQRTECEAWAVGIARDTGQLGPTWTRDGEFCAGLESECEHEPANLFQLRVYTGGLIKACSDHMACGEIFTDKDL